MSARELTIALGRRWHGGNGMARCAHNGRNPSLSIRTGDDGKLLVHCHAASTFSTELEWARMSACHLSQAQLAARWGVSPRTLERWRWRGEGPCFLKLGGRVAYRLSDIELFEQKRLRESTSDASALSPSA